MSISIIIPTMNKMNRLALTLKSLSAQFIPGEDIEMIVINDGSQEEYEPLFRELANQYLFRYYRTENKGRAYARNMGLGYAQNELIIFVDDDVIVAPNFIEEHLREQQRCPRVLHGEIKNFIYSYAFKDPIHGVLYDEEEQLLQKKEYVIYLQKQCQSLDNPNEYYSIQKCSKYMKLEKKILEVYEQEIFDMEWISFTGGNVSCPKKWLEESNGFDERFGLNWGCEDLEMGYRLKQVGREFGYAKGASCCHIDHQKIEAKHEHAISTEYFYEKHKDERILELNNYLFKQREL